MSICIVLRAFVVCGSRVSPSIVGFMRSVVLFICNASCVLYSAGSGVKRVNVVLYGLKMRWFICVHVCITCRYDGIFALNQDTNLPHKYVKITSVGI